MMNPYLVALIAFFVVMAGMAFLMGLFYALRTAGERFRPVPAGAAAGSDPELLAVIAAAAREALQAPVRVHRVHVHRGPLVEHWSRAGRMDIMISHRVEPKR
jgi:hypothetical protein